MKKRIVGCLGIVLSVVAAWAGGPKLVLPAPCVVFTMEGCAPCRNVEARLVRSGVKFERRETKSQPAVAAFPTVFYTDGKCDNGERILRGPWRLPNEPVTLVHWDPGRDGR